MSEVNELPDELQDLLLAQVVHELASTELNTTQWGGANGTWEFTRQPENSGVRLVRSGGDWAAETIGTTSQEVADSIVHRANLAAQSGEPSGTVCYATGFATPAFDVKNLGTQFARSMGDQVYISGWRRLSNAVLLEFKPPQVEPGTPLIFAPPIEVRVFIFAPGNTHGPLSQKLALDAAELTRIICTFALGRTAGPPPMTIFPAKSEDVPEATAALINPEIGGLARDHVSLDPFGDLASLGGLSSVAKYRNALVAFDAATTQSNPDVATILLVSGIEAIISPGSPWRKSRLTTRFVKSVQEYALDTVDNTLDHSNMQMAFSFRPSGGRANQRKRMLERVYDLRSTPVHAGPTMAIHGFMAESGAAGQLRVALISDLFRAVLLGFLRAPRCSLIGHPDIWPSPAESS